MAKPKRKPLVSKRKATKASSAKKRNAAKPKAPRVEVRKLKSRSVRVPKGPVVNSEWVEDKNQNPADY
jgi:hypothetical protein